MLVRMQAAKVLAANCNGSDSLAVLAATTQNVMTTEEAEKRVRKMIARKAAWTEYKFTDSDTNFIRDGTNFIRDGQLSSLLPFSFCRQF
jgi:hypothetical protein